MAELSMPILGAKPQEAIPIIINSPGNSQATTESMSSTADICRKHSSGSNGCKIISSSERGTCILSQVPSKVSSHTPYNSSPQLSLTLLGQQGSLRGSVNPCSDLAHSSSDAAAILGVPLRLLASPSQSNILLGKPLDRSTSDGSSKSSATETRNVSYASDQRQGSSSEQFPERGDTMDRSPGSIPPAAQNVKSTVSDILITGSSGGLTGSSGGLNQNLAELDKSLEQAIESVTTAFFDRRLYVGHLDSSLKVVDHVGIYA